jgi:hypothetical protein
MSGERRVRAYFAKRCRDEAKPLSRVELGVIAELLDEDDRAADAPKKKRLPSPDTRTKHYFVAREFAQMLAQGKKPKVATTALMKRWRVKKDYVDKARRLMRAERFTYSPMWDAVVDLERRRLGLDP